MAGCPEKAHRRGADVGLEEVDDTGDEQSDAHHGILHPGTVRRVIDEPSQAAAIGVDVAECVFCSIVAGRLPAHEVWRDDVVVAFLDRSPVFEGHVLVVPVGHVVTLADLPVSAVGPFFERVQRITAAVPAALGADGTFVANNNIVSQSVAHLHVHVVPRRRKDGLRGFFWPRRRYASDIAAEETAAMIRAALTLDPRQ